MGNHEVIEVMDVERCEVGLSGDLLEGGEVECTWMSCSIHVYTIVS